MTTDYRSWAGELQRLDRSLTALLPRAEALGVESPRGAVWFELLQHKLLPQARSRPMLVVAVVGGTNIGKSLLFNHLAGENASGVSPLAAGTKHPVLLVPPGFADSSTLAQVFSGFQLRAWTAADSALEACDEDLLFWRPGERVPDRLLLLDTPDIDSDAQVNWRRAETIRETADVLIAVLTQQKYNDAAVKQFFRQAAKADKVALVVFNQCDPVEDAAYWPVWLETFVSETGCQPELTYVVPHDRRAAAELRLPCAAVGVDGRSPPQPADLRADLAALHFDAIKIRTFRGALRTLLDPGSGVPAFQRQVQNAAQRFEQAADALTKISASRPDWPVVPTHLLVDEITAWWDDRRPGWSRAVHGFYRTVGRRVLGPVRAAYRQLTGPVDDPLVRFHEEERLAILEVVDQLFLELERLATVGNEVLQPRLRALLNGRARAQVIEQVEAARAALPALDDDYRDYLRGELDAWGHENPRAVWWLANLDHAAALARPALTLTLVVGGGAMAIDVAAQAAAEAAIAGGVVAAGEAVAGAADEGLRQAAARLFRRLQTHYTDLRGTWLQKQLEGQLLGPLLAELRRHATVPRTPAFDELTSAIVALNQPVELTNYAH